jgi:hypothetical protein
MLTFFGYPLPPVPSGVRVTARPWWVNHRMQYFRREDGLILSATPRPSAEMWSVMRHGKTLEDFTFPLTIGSGDDTSREALARVDRTYPRPCPPPLLGQVWVHEGNSSMLTEPAAVGLEWTTEPVGVLVYGPFAPWAPPDWSPPK